MIRIIDCGSQLTQNIARRIREHGVFSTIVPFNSSLKAIMEGNPDGIIISGGQFSVYGKGAPLYAREILDLKIPILGICYGQQSIAFHLGGKVESTPQREYGQNKIILQKPSRLFNGLPQESKVWMSHGDIVSQVPPDFEITAISEGKHIAAMQGSRERANIYAVQFHPEVDHTEYGRNILGNFLEICNAKKDWSTENFVPKIIANIRETVGNKKVIGGMSGGVDSSTASVLLAKAIGDNYTPILINNGLLRKGEAEEVLRTLTPYVKSIKYIDATDRFLKKLEGISSPDEKRKIIGKEFIKVFQEAASGIEAEYLMQGTLYPDVIESVPVYGCSSKIKLHHNVGGLPEKMGLKLIEPFRDLFKDEVRQIGEKLGLPKELVWRHPFPGPGLAVRIIGDVTKEKLDILREADTICVQELKARGIYYNISQAFAVLTNASSVGVMGDEGNYQYVIALRAVTTNDFMTADWYDFKKEDLGAIATRIINEVKGVNRIVYDITQKPPATIEWE